uniref:Uncharacterized protein n=1 Tax=Callithrix jacchus TaxID=9483 RepID=A0A8I3W0Z3_CALJA
MPTSQKLVSSSSSGSDSDSEVDKKLKRKKQVAPEKPVRKQKTGETSRALSSSKQSGSSRDDNISDWENEDLTLSPRLEYSGTIIAHNSLDFLGSSNPPTSASQVVGTTGMSHHIQVILKIFVKTGSHYVAQVGLELPGLRNPPISASQSVEIIGMNHHIWPILLFNKWETEAQGGAMTCPRLYSQREAEYRLLGVMGITH